MVSTDRDGHRNLDALTAIIGASGPTMVAFPRSGSASVVSTGTGAASTWSGAGGSSEVNGACSTGTATPGRATSGCTCTGLSAGGKTASCTASESAAAGALIPCISDERPPEPIDDLDRRAPSWDGRRADSSASTSAASCPASSAVRL